MDGSSKVNVLNREIRVFLSSTFRDMQAERNYLLTNVFPGLRELCSRRQVVFTEIDLRWGVTEEESKNGMTVEICLDEIARCRNHPPFFIGFLGERYGWIPSEEDLNSYWELRKDSEYANRIRSALGDGISVTELEIQYAILDNPQRDTHARIFLRDSDLTDELFSQEDSPDVKDYYDDGGGRLEVLKEKIRNPELGVVGGHSYKTVQEFGKSVEQFLREEIDNLYPEDEVPSPEQIIDNAHRNYAATRRRAYVPIPELRSQLLVAFQAAGKDNISQRILIEGESGLGKSAFVADLESWLPMQQQIWLHSHYVGVDGNLTLANWCDRILYALEELAQLDLDLPIDPKKRWEALPNALSKVQNHLDVSVVLLLDAVNQLTEEDAFRRLSALSLPVNVVLVVSATPDVVSVSSRDAWQCLVQKPLNEDQRYTAISEYLSSYRKNLDPKIVKLIACEPACGVPLYLRLVLEELRIHALHETLSNVAEALLKFGATGSLFESVLRQMDVDHADDTHANVVSWLALLIASSETGLSRRDLSYLVASPQDPVDPASSRPKLPDSFLSVILSRLGPYLLEGGERIKFNHSAIDKALLSRAAVINARQAITVNVVMDPESRSYRDYFYARNYSSQYFLPLLQKKIENDLSVPKFLSSLNRDDLFNIIDMYSRMGGRGLIDGINNSISFGVDYKDLKKILAGFDYCGCFSENYVGADVEVGLIQAWSAQVKSRVIKNSIQSISISKNLQRIPEEFFDHDDYSLVVGHGNEDECVLSHSAVLLFSVNNVSPEPGEPDFYLEKVLAGYEQILSVCDLFASLDDNLEFTANIQKIYSIILAKFERYLSQKFENVSKYADKFGNVVLDSVDEDGVPYDIYCSQELVESGFPHKTTLIEEAHRWFGDDVLSINLLSGFEKCRRYLLPADRERLNSIVDDLIQWIVVYPYQSRVHPSGHEPNYFVKNKHSSIKYPCSMRNSNGLREFLLRHYLLSPSD